MFGFGRKKGSQPIADAPILYGYDNAQHFYQAKWSWPWPPAPAHETRAALTNCWTGNQLPGWTNFIPGVPVSTSPWQNTTAYMNTLRNQQYNVGFNIQTATAVENAILTKMVQQAWQNRMQYATGE